MILGLPIYLVAVCPMLMAAEHNLVNLGYGYLLTIGIVMEHGMIVHETAIARINQLLKDQATLKLPPPAHSLVGQRHKARRRAPSRSGAPLAAPAPATAPRA